MFEIRSSPRLEIYIHACKDKRRGKSLCHCVCHLADHGWIQQKQGDDSPKGKRGFVFKRLPWQVRGKMRGLAELFLESPIYI